MIWGHSDESCGEMFTNMFKRYLKWRNPEPYIRQFWGWLFPYISCIHTAYKRCESYLHFRYLKCLVKRGLDFSRNTTEGLGSPPLRVDFGQLGDLARRRKRVVKSPRIQPRTGWFIFGDTVGRNPANSPVEGTVVYPIYKVYTFQVVVWDFFHQQYHAQNWKDEVNET